MYQSQIHTKWKKKKERKKLLEIRLRFIDNSEGKYYVDGDVYLT